VGTIRSALPRCPRARAQDGDLELQRRGFDACEIDFEGKFWMDYAWAALSGAARREAWIVLRAPPDAGFMGHVERDKKQRMAVGMLDHSAGIARPPAPSSSSSPGFSLGRRPRRGRSRSITEQLADLRERLEARTAAVRSGRDHGPRPESKPRTTC
jgi:hypothetical protein